MSDPFAMFSDLPNFPGKKEPVLRSQPKAEPTLWDTNPRVYKVGGVPTNFYTVSHLAAAVNRSVRTIRHWERTGVIPPATFRAPLKGARGTGKHGDRLYSREQIEVIIKAAKRTGVMKGRGNNPTREFTDMIIKGWLQLQGKA